MTCKKCGFDKARAYKQKHADLIQYAKNRIVNYLYSEFHLTRSNAIRHAELIMKASESAGKERTGVFNVHALPHSSKSGLVEGMPANPALEKPCECGHEKREHGLDGCLEFFLTKSGSYQCDCNKFKPKPAKKEE